MQFLLPDHNEYADSDWNRDLIRATSNFPLDVRVRLCVRNIHQTGALSGTLRIVTTTAVGGGGATGACVTAAAPGVLHVVHLQLQMVKRFKRIRMKGVFLTNRSGQLAHFSSLTDNTTLGHAGTYSTQAHLGVYPLEGLGQDISNVGQVEQEQRHANDCVQNGHQLSPLGLGCNVPIPDCRDHGQRKKDGARETPLLHVGSLQLLLHYGPLVIQQRIVNPATVKFN